MQIDNNRYLDHKYGSMPGGLGILGYLDTVLALLILSENCPSV